jgi:hypothetical protein
LQVLGINYQEEFNELLRNAMSSGLVVPPNLSTPRNNGSIFLLLISIGTPIQTPKAIASNRKKSSKTSEISGNPTKKGYTKKTHKRKGKNLFLFFNALIQLI